MVPVCCIYIAQRRRRQYVLVETSTFPLYWVKHDPSSTDVSKYFYKRNNNKKKDYYIELSLFFLCWLACFKSVRNKNVQVFRIGLTFFWQYTCQNICDSFFLYWRCFNVFLLLFFFFLFFNFIYFIYLFFFFFFVVVVLFCKLRQTDFRHRCFEKEELFFVSWLYFWYE